MRIVVLSVLLLLSGCGLTGLKPTQEPAPEAVDNTHSLVPLDVAEPLSMRLYVYPGELPGQPSQGYQVEFELKPSLIGAPVVRYQD